MQMQNSYQRYYLNCSYIPPEILAAADIEAYRPWPQEFNPSGGDLLPYDTCPYSRAFLEISRPGTVFSVTANCCDAMRRVYDHLTPDSMLLEIPRQTDRAGVDYFYQQLKNLLQRLGIAYRSADYRNRLQQEIAKYNGWRRQLKDLREELSWGSGSFALLLKGIELFYQGRGEELPRLREGIKAVPDHRGVPVIVLSSTLLEAGLLTLLEGSGFRIMGLDSCPGERSFNYGPLKTEKDEEPLQALARYYLTGSACPRMMEVEKRLQEIRMLSEARPVEGLVYFLPKFCDQAAYDFKLIKEQAAGRGLPVLQIEGEYYSSRSGQLKTRVAAFRESLLLRRG